MNRRMSMGGDASLNSPLREEGEGEWQDWLADDTPGQDVLIAEDEESQLRHELLTEAMSDLNDREKHILTERRLRDDPLTLEELSQQYGVSRSEEHTSELQSLMRISYAVFCLKKKKEKPITRYKTI